MADRPKEPATCNRCGDVIEGKSTLGFRTSRMRGGPVDPTRSKPPGLYHPQCWERERAELERAR